MAEDKNKLKEEQLQDEQLDEVNGGGSFRIIPPEVDLFNDEPFSNLLWTLNRGRASLLAPET